jgi:cobalt-zinc-cadmium efflux system protein
MVHSHGHHGHPHSGGSEHGHGPASYDRAFAIGVVLNIGIVLAELVFGYFAHSLALMADAFHKLNGAVALMFMRGRHDDLNIKGAFLHMLADAAVSFGVVVAALVTLWTGWLWIDPATSLCIAVFVLWAGWGLARSSVNLALDAVPENVDRASVQAYLNGLPGVTEVHDLHIWAMSTTETALTVHLVRPDAGVDDGFIAAVCECLDRNFKIHHATVQIEHSREPCRLAPDHVV